MPVALTCRKLCVVYEGKLPVRAGLSISDKNFR